MHTMPPRPHLNLSARTEKDEFHPKDESRHRAVRSSILASVERTDSLRAPSKVTRRRLDAIIKEELD